MASFFGITLRKRREPSGVTMLRKKCLSILLLLTPPLSAQNVVVDWVGKNIISSPSKINKKTKAEIYVENVNDVLYTYSIQVTGVPRVDNDFGALEKGFVVGKGAGEGAANPCDDPVKAVQIATAELGAAVSTFYHLPETQSKSCSKATPCSINIADTRVAWTSGVAPKANTASAALAHLQQLPICQKAYSKEIGDLQTALDSVTDRSAYIFSPHHTISTETTLEPDVDYTVDVKELYMTTGVSTGIQTNADTLSVKFQPATDRLTLSAGVLFSEIQNRGYTSQVEPNATGTGTQNVLAVSGINEFSPLAVALLNYEIPPIKKLSFGNDDIGLAVSSGPVIRLSSSSNTSSFGYFVGIGVHLYHRFYISPGVHIGEFADYPPGFSAPGQIVPPGLGTPIPINRFTARFSFGVTYKAKDFSSLGLSASTQTTPSPASKLQSPAPAQTGKK